MSPTQKPRVRKTQPGSVAAVYLCYFLSGAMGLVYQILWLRQLLLIFGSTVHAVGTILTVFFGGLALGSWLFGRLIDRYPHLGLRWYALLEACVGLYAFATPWLFSAVRFLYIPVYRASGFSPAVLVGASFFCCALILLVPTTLLGGTFPVLSRFLIRADKKRAEQIAALYGVNTLGAMSGTLFVYFLGLPILGAFRTLVSAGLVNLLIALVSNAANRKLSVSYYGKAPSVKPVAVSVSEGRIGSFLLVAFAISGFSAMVYEVAWTRALSLILGSSIYAFCVMLSTFLFGIAIGSFLVRWFLRFAPATLRQFIVIEWLLGIYGLVSVPLFVHLPDGFVLLWPIAGKTFTALTLVQFAVCSLAMLLPTILMGVLFPIVSDLVTRQFATLGSKLGRIYAVNTLGGIFGSFLAGFLLVPYLGLCWSIIVAGLLNFLAGTVLYIVADLRRIGRMVLGAVSMTTAVALSFLVIAPSWKQQVFAAGVYLNPGSYQNMSVANSLASSLIFYKDSLNATVSVHKLGDSLFLKVGGKTDASNGIDMGTQVLSAQVPMLLHPDPHRVLVIGLGSGVTLGSAGRFPVTTLDCAELDPAVIEAARYFREYNYDVHHDPRARMLAVDGRNFLFADDSRYDVIVSEPSNPWMAGIAFLFTEEFYALAKKRLAPGGIMCQWIQLYHIFPEDVKLMLKTFHHAFAHVSVWSSILGDLLLVGSDSPLEIPYAELSRRMQQPKIKETLGSILVDRPDVLLQLFWFNQEAVESLTSDVQELHQDDQPALEFNGPKALYLSDQQLFANNLGLQRFRQVPKAIVPDYPQEAMDKDLDHLKALARLWAYRGEGDQELGVLEKLALLDPKDSASQLRLSELYDQTGQYEKAKELLLSALKNSPSQEAYIRLGRLAWKRQELGEARQFYEKASAAGPLNMPLAAELGGFYGRTGDFQAAVNYYQAAASEQLPPHDALMGLASALMQLQRWPEAEEVLKKAVVSYPDSPQFPRLLGQTLMAENRPQEAKPWYHRMLQLSPQSVEAYYQLGQIAAGQGQMEEARLYLQQCLRYSPFHRQAADLLHQITPSSQTD